jgi:hypothetical protein
MLLKWGEMANVYESLDTLGITNTPNAWISAIDEASATAFNIYTGREWEIEVDTVILVTMKYSNTDIVRLAKTRASVPVHTIGDALAPRQVADAVLEANRLAHAL